MKRRQFLASTLATALLTVGVTTACGGAPDSASEGNTLIMATSADYPPYEFVETAGGTENIVGFDVDIARHITEQLGYELEIVNMDFNGLIPALQAGRADFVMAGMTPTEERLENADFSEIYYDAQQTIISAVDSGISSPADLSGKKVGVQLGSIQEGLAKELADATPDMELALLNRITEIVQELKSGRIGAAIIEDTVAKGHLEANPDLRAAIIPEEGPAGSAIAFPKGSELLDDFDGVLAEMQASGKMEELINRWFGDREE